MSNQKKNGGIANDQAAEGGKQYRLPPPGQGANLRREPRIKSCVSPSSRSIHYPVQRRSRTAFNRKEQSVDLKRPSEYNEED